MATSISAAMLAELRGKARVYPVFETTINSTAYRFASEPIASESQGRYEPFVQNWGVIERAIGDFPDYSLQFPKTSVDIYDKDRVIQKLVGGPASGSVGGSVAKIVLRSDHVASANHYTLFDGIITDYKLIGDRLWQFVISPDDRELRAESNNIQTLTRAGWFSGLPEPSIGLDGQIVYGEHSSAGIEGATGLVECPLFWDPDHIDDTWWLISVGYIEELLNVWRNDTLATSDFAASWWYLNGGIYSLVQDTAGTSTADDTITVDVKGVIDNSGGNYHTGDLIEDPADVLEHFLTNFVFGAYPTGSEGYEWLSSADKPIDSTYFSEVSTFLSNRGHKCAKVITSSESPVSVLNDFCKSYKVSPFWSADWELAIRAFDHAVTTTYLGSANHISQRDHKILSEIVGETDSAKVVSGIAGNYVYQDASGSYTFQAMFEDPDRTTKITSDSFLYGKAKIT